jgi:hypothetical protein
MVASLTVVILVAWVAAEAWGIGQIEKPDERRSPPPGGGGRSE